MTQPFTPEQEARVREIVAEALARQQRPLFGAADADSFSRRVSDRANAIGLPVTPAGVAEIARLLGEEEAAAVHSDDCAASDARQSPGNTGYLSAGEQA